MRSSQVPLARAVRTFMAVAPQRSSSHSTTAAGKCAEQPSGKHNPSADNARRIASAMLRARQANRQNPCPAVLDVKQRSAQSDAPHASSPSSSLVTPPTSLSPAAAGLWESASSLAKSAYVVHLAHQHRYDGYPTHDLASKVEQDWDAWGPVEKEQWIKATPQGRKAFQLLQAEIARESGERDGAGSSAVRSVWREMPLQSRWSKKYDGRVVRRRRPAPGAIVPRLSPTEAPRQYISGRLLPFAPATESPTVPSATRARLAATTKEVEATVRKGLWQRQLASTLGREGATTFATVVKNQQRCGQDESASEENREVEEAGMKQKQTVICGRRRRGARPTLLWATPPSPASAGKGPAACGSKPDDPTYTETFLAFCSSIGVSSPRKIYIMNKLLPHLDSFPDGGEQQSLMEVKELAAKLSAEYDAHVAELEKAGKRDALEAYEKALIKEELDRLQEKLAKFQSQLPLLVRWLHALNDRRA